MKRALWIAVIMCSTQTAFAQTPPAPAFDVASIRPSPEEFRGYIRFLPGGRFSGMSSINYLIQIAYGVQSYQMIGAPKWLDTDRYVIEAKTDRAGATREEMTAMLRTLLADRFKLRLRPETREFPVYNLVLGKGGWKLKPLATDQAFHCTRDNTFVCGITSPAGLAGALRNIVKRIVLDKTGIDGRYEILLDFDTYAYTGGTPPADYNKPSLDKALEEQLGLRLVPAKESIPVYIVESVEKPTAN